MSENPTVYTEQTDTFTLNNPTRFGYQFLGWTGSNGNIPQKTVTIEKGSSGNKTYIANWKGNAYTIVYEGNGATGGNTQSSTHTYGTEKTLTVNGYVRQYTLTYDYNGSGVANSSTTVDWTFKNWNTEANGTGASYADGQAVRDLTSVDGAMITLYAQWNSASVTLPKPSRAGYTFIEWNTKADGTGTSYLPNETIELSTNATLYTIWKDTTPPTVALQPNGGSYIIPSSGNLTIQTKITVSDNESGFSTLQYAWSTNQKIQLTTGWKNFSNGETVTLPDYTDTNYYLWVKVVDKAGNIANNIRVSNAFSVYSIQLKSGPIKTEYESGESVDYTGITIVQHNDVLGDKVIDNSLYTISSTKNDDIANNIRYKITISYEGYTWNIDTYKDKWYGIVGNTWYYYQNHEKLSGMQDLAYYNSYFGRDTINTYYFNNDGTMLTGWQSIGGYWYYMNSSGQMTTGWQQIGGSWYFLRQSANQYGTGPAGSMLANTSAYINGKTYYFNASGVCTNP